MQENRVGFRVMHGFSGGATLIHDVAAAGGRC
jgi:hypothetical protein